ncbi:MAG: hypothetical protein WC768_05070 [Patescibacteria group bacterium]|jgi:hypothetical protein
MKQNFDSIVSELRFYLTRQLEAYQKSDNVTYSQLEEKILELEKKL